MSDQMQAVWIRVGALGATIVLGAAVVGILSLRSDVSLANGRRIGALKAMFVEKATSSYSLSSLQLYIWLFCGVSAYLYFLGAKVFAQNQWDLFDVPDSIVNVTLISISTSVLSTGVTSISGGKGSGEFNPTPSDLISSGGDVAPERVQQLLWTLIAAPAFLVFAYNTDPAHMQDVKGIPDHFLQLMGVSSAGFVTGKIARGPGPKITNLTATWLSGPPPYAVLNIQGNDIQTNGASFTLADLGDKQKREIPCPATIMPSSVIDGSGVATALDLAIPSAGLRVPVSGMRWNYEFTVYAADGEKAAWQF